MTYKQARIQFTLFVAKLILYMHEIGLQPAGGYLKRCKDCPVGKVNSNHKLGLAIDIDLYDKDGNWLKFTEDHQKSGDFWEALHPWCRWGGRYNDGNHYEFIMGGWRK